MAKTDVPDADDRSQVKAVATEYFQAWFAGDGERIRATLHPHLALPPRARIELARPA
jgi:hypothetical protein